MKFSWKNFPEMLLIHDPKSEILKKAWKNFPRNPLSDHPVFGNIFQDLAIWVKKIDGKVHDKKRLLWSFIGQLLPADEMVN